jgi:alkylated DNA nucleotide flippase Atl1
VADRSEGDSQEDWQEDWVEDVLTVVESIPPGRVTTYGTIAETLGRYGARRVGNVMAHYGAGVPWWRVVRADGSLPPSHEGEAGEHYRAEGTPLKPSGSIDMRAAFWEPSPARGECGGTREGGAG